MAEDEYDFIFKILLLGDSNVGKSSLISRYVDGLWSDVFVPTIGVDFKIKTLEIGNKNIKMQIWDTAGQERFRNIISSYFRGSHGILLIYDITNKNSFNNLQDWLEVIENNANKNVLKILIGNKNDLEEDRQIKTEEGQSFANRNNMQFIETSAKTNTNVTDAFEALAKIMMEFNSDKKPISNQNQKVNVSSGKNLNTKKKCC